ncbi:MAG: hypothetical protein KIS92_08320 [Planctomycetota bacterium]|nr:hypothetical protein [Planctomycetota bacterium]
MTDFKTAFDRIERLIETRYGVEVNISDVLDPNTGDLDGQRIKLDYTLDLETAFFVLLHLFGHTVQWNLSEEYRALGHDLAPGKDDATMRRIHEYESNATRYSLALLHEADIHDLDRWVSDMFAADWAFLEHFYRTGQKLDFKDLFKPGHGPLLTELPIPAFHPQRWISRWSF